MAPDALSALLQSNREQLKLLRLLLSSVDADHYTRPVPLMEGAWIGKHVRHVLDIYLCLFQAIESGEVVYERRQRDPRIECERTAALDLLEEVQLRLMSVQPEDRTLGLATTEAGHIWILPTHLSRELLYATEHSIHHFALIRMAIRSSCPDISIPAEFGIAPSTLRHQSETRRLNEDALTSG